MTNPYLEDYRLSEVIALIVALSVTEYTFRSNSGLDRSFRTTAKSAKDWIELSKQHPEFFRLGKDEGSVALLIRYFDKADSENADKKPPLTIDQTQKLVDQALELHDKQLGRYQRNSFRVPILATIISGVIAIVIATISLTNNTQSMNKLDQLNNKIDSLQIQLIKK